VTRTNHTSATEALRRLEALGERKTAELITTIQSDSDTEESPGEPALPQFVGFDDLPRLPQGF
jgi:hypothetical protein